jgi:hypothetical protein
MYLPELAEINNRAKKSIIEWAGLDRRALIADNSFSSTTNLSSRNYPLISPRPSRETVYTLTSGKALFAATELAWVDGTNFKYNNVTEGTVTASAKSMVELSGRIVIFPDNVSYDTVGDTFAAMQGSVPMSQYGYDAYGVVDTTATTKIHNTTRVTVTPSTSYTLTNDKTYTAATAYYFDANSVFISSAAVNFASFTTPSTAYSMNFDITGTDITVVVKITNAVYPTQGAIPDIDYACTLNNRIWGVDGDNVYGSALGQYDNWTTFSSPSEATDAYQVDTGTNGDFTGIVSYKGFVLVFKRDRVFKLFGDIPSDFQLVEISRLGCLSNKSICEVNNILFWLSPQGVVAYTGGIPEVISECLNDTYTSGVGGGDGRWYYASLYNGTAYALYTYDTWKGIFLQEDTLNVTEFAFLDGYLYALTSANVISKFNSGTETVSSETVTKELTEEASNKKGHSELFFRADLQTGATMAVYVRHDNGSFTLVKNYNTTDLTSFKVALKVKNCDHFQVKLIMTGDYAIHQWQRKFIVGESD